jgi:membrane protein YqaA with SNARE-associated domain
MFQTLYDKVLNWSKHQHAPKYLFGLSFAESSFFPIPPDVMLAPMALARPEKAIYFAMLTTLASVLGGMFGYAIGYFAFDLIAEWLKESHYWDKYLLSKQWFDEWGVWAVLIAGFSPIPYKIFTITAGALSMLFLPFVLASAVGRGGRFFLVAILLAWGGEKLEKTLRVYMDRIGWASVFLIIVAGGVYKYMTMT